MRCLNEVMPMTGRNVVGRPGFTSPRLLSLDGGDIASRICCCLLPLPKRAEVTISRLIANRMTPNYSLRRSCSGSQSAGASGPSEWTGVLAC